MSFYKFPSVCVFFVCDTQDPEEETANNDDDDDGDDNGGDDKPGDDDGDAGLSHPSVDASVNDEAVGVEEEVKEDEEDAQPPQEMDDELLEAVVMGEEGDDETVGEEVVVAGVSTVQHGSPNQAIITLSGQNEHREVELHNDIAIGISDREDTDSSTTIGSPMRDGRLPRSHDEEPSDEEDDDEEEDNALVSDPNPSLSVLNSKSYTLCFDTGNASPGGGPRRW